jgi:hypothetical protein
MLSDSSERRFIINKFLLIYRINEEQNKEKFKESKMKGKGV